MTKSLWNKYDILCKSSCHIIIIIISSSNIIVIVFNPQ